MHVGKLVFKDKDALQDFAKKNDMKIYYILNKYPEPELNPEKPSELKPMLRATLWVFDEGKQVLVVSCFESSKLSKGIWTEEDEQQLEWKVYIKRLKDYHQFQPETLAIIEEMEDVYEGTKI